MPPQVRAYPVPGRSRGLLYFALDISGGGAMPYVSGVGFDPAALGVGLAGAFFLVLALGIWLLKSYGAPTLGVTRRARPVPAAPAGLRYAGADELEPARHSLHALLRSCFDLLEPIAGEKGLGLELSLSPGLPDAIEVDAERVHRVLVDLIHGAIQLTEAGRVKVQVDAVDVTAERFGLRARVEESRAGAGSSFQAVIPVVRRAEVKPAAAPSSAPPPLVPLRLPSPAAPILVVDDDELDQVVALELLETLGFQTELATGGAAAVDLVSRGKYSLVLMDCEMPELDGYTAVRRIRELARSPHLPIIACTAGSMEQRKRALDAGMDDCLTKPLTRATLCRILAMYLPDDKNPASSGTRLTSAAARTLRPRGAAEPPDLAPRHRSDRRVDLFVTQVPEELHELAVAADMDRPDELARRASKLESICLGCGAMKMAAVCATLKYAPNLSKEQLSGRLKALNDAFLVVMRVLGEASPSSESTSAPASQHNPDAP